jgi:hypothetical protein
MQAAPKNGWSVLKHDEKECGRSLCGYGAVQHVGAYSVRLGYAITFVASVAGNGNGNGNRD